MKLTRREQQVLALIAEGRTTKEISAVLTCAAGTVSNHRKSLCRKLHVHSTAELVRYAVIRLQYCPIEDIEAVPAQAQNNHQRRMISWILPGTS